LKIFYIQFYNLNLTNIQHHKGNSATIIIFTWIKSMYNPLGEIYARDSSDQLIREELAVIRADGQCDYPEHYTWEKMIISRSLQSFSE
ncbi:hypothetical protein CHS0354_034774, partial [Potamilus streckersoni]